MVRSGMGFGRIVSVLALGAALCAPAQAQSTGGDAASGEFDRLAAAGNTLGCLVFELVLSGYDEQRQLVSDPQAFAQQRDLTRQTFFILQQLYLEASVGERLDMQEQMVLAADAAMTSLEQPADEANGSIEDRLFENRAACRVALGLAE